MPDHPPGAPTDRPRQPPAPTVLTSLVLVLVRPLGPVNLGMIARTASNLGIGAVRLVQPHVPALDDQALRFATGWGRGLLERATSTATLAEAVADLGLVLATSGEFHQHELGPPLPIASVPTLVASRAAVRWGLVFGGEADGLTAAELASCHGYLHLDTFGENRSYNLTQAVAILGYLLASLGAAAPSSPAVAPAVSAAQLGLLGERLGALLARAGHAHAQDERYRRRLLRLLRSLPLRTADADDLLAMVSSLDRALSRSAARP